MYVCMYVLFVNLTLCMFAASPLGAERGLGVPTTNGPSRQTPRKKDVSRLPRCANTLPNLYIYAVNDPLAG